MRADIYSIGEATTPYRPAVGSRVPTLDAHAIGDLAADALTAELNTWPKPGLVSPTDSGSHSDMNAETFRRSVAALRPFFVELGAAGSTGANMDELREIGIRAEHAMLSATSGINTHRGAIFALGLLCAAAGRVMSEDTITAREPLLSSARLAATLQRCWGAQIVQTASHGDSHGAIAARLFGAGGAQAEAVNGFPHARWIGLPALRAARAITGDEGAARVQAIFALMVSLEDTNLLYRGGLAGLRYARMAAEEFLAFGGVVCPGWLDRAVSIHRDFVSRRLSPGGSADLLAVTIFLDRIEGLK